MGTELEWTEPVLKAFGLAMDQRIYEIRRHEHPTSDDSVLAHTHAWGDLHHQHAPDELCAIQECQGCRPHTTHPTNTSRWAAADVASAGRI
jgi:hypothetical protein